MTTISYNGFDCINGTMSFKPDIRNAPLEPFVTWFQTQTTVTTLEMKFGSLGRRDDAKQISQLLTNASLKVLNLWSNSLRDEGVEIIAPSLTTSSLESLVLAYNDISIEGVKAVAENILSTKITVDFTGNLIHDNEVDELERTIDDDVFERLIFNSHLLEDRF